MFISLTIFTNGAYKGMSTQHYVVASHMVSVLNNATEWTNNDH